MAKSAIIVNGLLLYIAKKWHKSFIFCRSALSCVGTRGTFINFVAGFDFWLPRDKDEGVKSMSGRGSGNFFVPSDVPVISETVVSDDAQLINRALAGQTEAFGELVLKYQNRLFNTFLHVVGHTEDARDVVQEALVQAFLKLDSFRSESTFYTWLYRIAFNVAITQRRKRRKLLSLESWGDNPAETCAEADNNPAENLERVERCRQVRRAIAQLPEEYRSLLVLREIDGCCYETIAEVLDLPIGTVRSRLHRARLQLREILKEMLAKEEIGERQK